MAKSEQEILEGLSNIVNEETGIPAADVQEVTEYACGSATLRLAEGDLKEALRMAEVALRLPRPRDSALELWVEPAGQVAAPLAKAGWRVAMISGAC